MLPHVAWDIWKERNNRIFRDKNSYVFFIACRIQNAIKKNFSSCCPSHRLDPAIPSLDQDWETINRWQIGQDISKPIVKIKQTRHNVVWVSPPRGWIKINVDGVAKGNPWPNGCGGVACDHNGRLISIVTLPLGTQANHFGEANAAYIGLQMVVREGF